MSQKNNAQDPGGKTKTTKSLPVKKRNASLPPFDVWIDKQDVMLEFHVSERTLYNWRIKKILPFARLGKKIIYNRSLIEQMLKNGMQR